MFLTEQFIWTEHIGLYPIPDYPFQEIPMDLCENLNKVRGIQSLVNSTGCTVRFYVNLLLEIKNLT
jgi:hypothetical protein